MKSLVVLLCLGAPALGSLLLSNQYQAQDVLGQYSYGYSGGSSAKQEVQTHDGVTRGTFSYVDGNGHVQSRSYVADDVHGFRVAATDLPVGPSAHTPLLLGLHAHGPVVAALGVPQPVHDTPEVVAAKISHAYAHAEALARAHLGRRRRNAVTAVVNHHPYGAGSYSWATTPASHSNVLLAGPHAGLISAGYAGVPVAALGVPQPVHDTPEVVAAKIAHAHAHAEALARAHGRRRRRSLGHGVEAVVGPSSPETVIAGPNGAGVVIAPAIPGGSVVRGHGITAVAAPAAAPAVLVAPTAHAGPVGVEGLVGHDGHYDQDGYDGHDEHDGHDGDDGHDGYDGHQGLEGYEKNEGHEGYDGHEGNEGLDGSDDGSYKGEHGHDEYDS